MNAIFYALTAYFGWGLGDTTGAIISRRMSSWSLTFWGFLIRLLLYTACIPFFISDLQGLTPTIALIAILVGSASALGYLSFYKATNLTNPTLAGAISCSWGASSLLYSLIFLREVPTISQSAALIVIFLGILMGILQTSKVITGRWSISIIKNKGIGYAFLSLLLWGICGSFIKIPITAIGWFWSTYALVIPFLIIALYQLVVRKNFPENPIKTKTSMLLIVYALFTVLAESAFNIGIIHGHVSVVAPIAGSYSTLYAVLSLLFFKEKLGSLQKLSVAITICGIVALSMVSV